MAMCPVRGLCPCPASSFHVFDLFLAKVTTSLTLVLTISLFLNQYIRVFCLKYKLGAYQVTFLVANGTGSMVEAWKVKALAAFLHSYYHSGQVLAPSHSLDLLSGNRLKKLRPLLGLAY